jgi:hypothetical protein
MSPEWRRLLSKHKGKTLVELCRRPKIQERIAGFVVGFSNELLLLHRLDWATFTLDGYIILRDSDVKNKRFFTRDSYWQSKAIQKLMLRPKALTGLTLNSLPEAINSISEQFPLISVESEIVRSDVAYIGVPLKFTPKLLVLDDLNCNAEWSGPRNLPLSQITRVDFGGGYERALAATAPKRNRKILRQYGPSLLERPRKSWLTALRAMRGLELHRIEEPKRN